MRQVDRHGLIARDTPAVRSWNEACALPSNRTLMCTPSAHTYTLSNYTCNVWIELDPRLPAGGSYGATLTVGAGGETLSVPLSAMLAH